MDNKNKKSANMNLIIEITAKVVTMTPKKWKQWHNINNGRVTQYWGSFV